jgi:pimeloyl-ACP methyl ester carboxylesterase
VGGFSFGAGPAVIAASAMPEVALAASFGGYADLRNVILFVTTGAHGYQGLRDRRAQEEYNRWKLLALLVGFVPDARDRERLDRIARVRLADPNEDTAAAEAALGDGARAMLMLVRARREHEVQDRLARLPAAVQARFEELSTVRAVPRLAGRLLIAHGAEDTSIPFTESLWLADAAGPRARVTILSGFHHAGPLGGWEALRSRALDGWRLWRLADDLLGP